MMPGVLCGKIMLLGSESGNEAMTGSCFFFCITYRQGLVPSLALGHPLADGEEFEIDEAGVHLRTTTVDTWPCHITHTHQIWVFKWFCLGVLSVLQLEWASQQYMFGHRGHVLYNV
jgi:hypothetical protein